MTFTIITRLCFGLAVAALLWASGYVWAQSQAPTPEQQLDQCSRALIQLRKANAQEAFRAASLEETLMDLRAKMAADEAKNKAAKSSVPDVGTK